VLVVVKTEHHQVVAISYSVEVGVIWMIPCVVDSETVVQLLPPLVGVASRQRLRLHVLEESLAILPIMESFGMPEDLVCRGLLL
jgi:hypothetical protein